MHSWGLSERRIKGVPILPHPVNTHSALGIQMSHQPTSLIAVRVTLLGGRGVMRIGIEDGQAPPGKDPKSYVHHSPVRNERTSSAFIFFFIHEHS